MRSCWPQPSEPALRAKMARSCENCARYRFEQDVAYGIVDGEQIREIAGTPFPEVAGIEVTGVEHHIDEVDLLAPVLPTKIIAVAKNYADHAREMGGEVPPSR